MYSLKLLKSKGNNRFDENNQILFSILLKLTNFEDY